MSADAKTAFVWKTVAFGRRGPGPRSRHGLAYDRGARTTVLFGGMRWSVPELLSDTWELWGGRWSPVKTRKHPPARHRGAMIYDARRGQCILFGGEAREGNDFIRLDDTWAYEGGHWRRLRSRCGPRPRCGHALAFDEGAGVVVLFGGATERHGPSLGDTWVFDGRSWHPIPGPAPAPRRYAVLGYDPELGGCLLNGGSEDDDGARGFGDTWLFRDGAWKRLASGLDTHTHDDFGLAYHRAAKRLVMFGGLAGPHDVLVRESDGWRSVEGLRLPPRQQCSPLVWDDDLDGLVYHGGEVSHGGAQFDTTWVLRLSRASAPLGTASRSAAPARGREARPLPVALTVRLLGQGVRAGKFPTSCSPREVLGAVDRMLHGLGLCVNKRGTVSGQLRHSHSALCAIPVDGTARKRGGRAEFVIDLSWHGRMTTAAILLSVFLFPVGLVLALVFTWTAQNGVQRIVDEAFGSLADDLAAD